MFEFLKKKKKSRARKKTGFADTKSYPHKNHPATYNRLKGDNVEYITFTHHNPAKIGNQSYETIPLNKNIEKEKRKTKEKSFAFPKVFVGKRSALGRENKKYSLVDEDKKIVKNLFKTLPRENVPYTSNSKKKKS